MTLGNLIVSPLMGKNLYNTETFGRADPYVIVKFGTHEGTTEVHKDAGTNPKWTSKFTWPIPSMTEVVYFSVFDKERVGKDELMGEGSFSLTQVASTGVWVGDIQLTRKNKPAGHIQVELRVQK